MRSKPTQSFLFLFQKRIHTLSDLLLANVSQTLQIDVDSVCRFCCEINGWTTQIRRLTGRKILLTKAWAIVIPVTTRNKAAMLTLRKSRQQSGQSYISQLYRTVQTLRRDGNTVTVLWLPASEECKRRVRARTPRQAGGKYVNETKRHPTDTASWDAINYPQHCT